MIKVFEAFSGIGSQAMALKLINQKIEFVGVSEIDEKVHNAYCRIHGEVKNYGDIAKIKAKNLPDFDLFTYTFPCQDISSMGLNKGYKIGENTRSSLLWECEKIIKEKKPKYLLMENVINVRKGKHKENFKNWERILEVLGYTNTVFDFDSQEIGFPQRRNRCFMFSILKESFKLDIREIKKNSHVNKSIDDIIEKKIKFESNYRFLEKMNLSLMNEKEYYFIDDRDWKMNGVMISKVSSTQRSGRSGLKIAYKRKGVFYYRNITPLESWRLMGFSDKDYELVKEIKKTQIYYICGNSIVLDVLYGIFKGVFDDKRFIDV